LRYLLPFFHQATKINQTSERNHLGDKLVVASGQGLNYGSRWEITQAHFGWLGIANPGERHESAHQQNHEYQQQDDPFHNNPLEFQVRSLISHSSSDKLSAAECPSSHYQENSQIG
jgi:hypothetical protein